MKGTVMEIIGDIEKADKFVVYKDDGSIEWVPQLAVAKAYVKNINNKNWYNKNIYATYENIVKLSDGRLFLQSQAPIEKVKVDNYTVFCTQALSFIENALFNLVKTYNHSSIEEMISWKSSTIKEKANEAKLAFTFRDKLYKYYYSFIEENKETLKSSEEALDLTELYNNFTTNLPKAELSDK